MNNVIKDVGVECPACAGTKASFIKTVRETSLYFCGSCRIRFAWPMIHPGQEWYEDSAIYDEVRWNLPPLRKIGCRWEFKRALSHLTPDTKTVFDVGCGRGDFLYLVKSKGFQAFGIDLNKILVKVAKEAYGLNNVYPSSIEEFLQKEGHRLLDVVTAFEVLEHLPDPKIFILNCRKLLRKDGLIILSVPGYHRFPHWVDNEVDLPPHHLTLWSESGLQHLLNTCGFKDISVEKKPLLLNDLMYHAVRYWPAFQKPGIVAKGARAILKLLLVFPFIILRTHPRSGGFTYLAVAKK